MSSGTTLQLYRHILRAAKKFPSVKKDGIIQNIKDEFRNNKVRLHGGAWDTAAALLVMWQHACSHVRCSCSCSLFSEVLECCKLVAWWYMLPVPAKQGSVNFSLMHRSEPSQA
eukprot:GHRR01022013.1.p3 GENE.GHRR01022013.1~~GHRR01022013.1.p3  ORF type:complete len:113 (+),score=21.27 GHRR01022013.1:1153-1491(+)